MPQEKIRGLEKTISSKYNNIAGIVILKNGEKVIISRQYGALLKERLGI